MLDRQIYAMPITSGEKILAPLYVSFGWSLHDGIPSPELPHYVGDSTHGRELCFRNLFYLQVSFEIPNMLYNGRANVEEIGSRLSITIPAKKNWGIIFFFCIWLTGWAIGGGFALQKVFAAASADGGSETFIKLWLVGWAYGVVLVLSLLLWTFFGKELIESDGSMLKVERTLFGIGVKRRFDITEVKNFRVIPEVEPSPFARRGNVPTPFSGGKIRFDFGLKSYSFGLELDQPEAQYLCDFLSRTVGAGGKP